MEFPYEIKTQEELDELIKGRLERARQQWESEGGLAEERDRAKEAESRAEAAEARARERIARRDLRVMLKDMGVTEMARQDRIMRLADLDQVGYDEQGEPNEKHLKSAIKQVHKDLPEVFGEAKVLEGAADASQGSPAQDQGSPITSEEQITAMSPEQINSNWDRISNFLSGKR